MTICKTNSKASQKMCQSHLAAAPPTDDFLLARIGKHKDRDALTVLYNRYKLPIGRFLLQKNCAQKLIDEVYNDVMLIVWRNAAKFEGKSKVSTWIFGIAYRVNMSHSRKEVRHSHVELSDYQEAELTYSSDSAFESHNELSLAIKTLSDKQKMVVIYAYFYGYSTEEIAALEGCPQNTVKTRLFHARQKLKKRLLENKAVPNNRTPSTKTGRSSLSSSSNTLNFMIYDSVFC